MPRKLRVPKGRRGPLAVAELAARARWGGLLPGVPELTDEQWEAWRVHNRDRWVPMAALAYFWDRVDRVHGCGGEIVLGRPRRPGDEDAGDGWSLSRFLNALDEDRRDVEEVVADHPEQASRLQRWFVAVDGLGRERDREQDRRIGHFYEQLSTLGYSSSAL